MSSRLPKAASHRASASYPPAGLPGLDPSFSRLVEVTETGSDSQRTRGWHILDNGQALTDSGIASVGTILCVHGNPTWSYLWRKLLAAATEQALKGGSAWRVIAVDQLDMGFSERTGGQRTLARRVLDLADLTASLRLQGPVVTFGHDWGGVVSLGWAVDHPDLVAAVLLLNTAVHQPDGQPIPSPLRLALSGPVLGASTVSTSGFLDTTLAISHPPLAREVRNAYRAPYRAANRRGGIGGFVHDIPVDDRHVSFDELTRIANGVGGLPVPSFFQWGPRDPIFSDKYLDDLLGRMPHADVHRYEGAGHMIAEDVDYATSALHWLDSTFAKVPGSGAADEEVPAVSGAIDDDGTRTMARADAQDPADTVTPALSGSTGSTRLWDALDELKDSSGTALIEMAPKRGRKPRVVSWKLLRRRVNQLAAGLTSIGVRSGDHVSLLITPGADLTAVLYACLRIGAVVVVADAGLGLRGLTRATRGSWPDVVIGETAGLAVAQSLSWPGRKISTARLPRTLAAALGVSNSLADIVRLGGDTELPPAPSPAADAAILFTSGSTGPAKGVVYTHSQLSALCAALADQYRIGRGTGLVAGFAPFALLGPALGARSVTPDMNVTSPRTLTARAVGEAAEAARATVVFLSPAALANVVKTVGGLTPGGRDALRKVTLFLSAGAPVSELLLTEASRLMPGAVAHTPYGMTEGLLLTDITLDEIRSASSSAGFGGSGGGASEDIRSGVCVGVPSATADVVISELDVTGEATGVPTSAPGVTGEVIVSAPHVLDHYHHLWATDYAARRNSSVGVHWHRTGDVGHFDSAGRLWIEGRLPHVIVTAQGIVTPVGVEQRIESVPGISRAALVGVGPRGTQQLVAVIERPGARRVALAASDVAHSVRAASGHPLAAVLVTPLLPTDIRHNSKIDRTALAAWATRILAGGHMGRP